MRQARIRGEGRCFYHCISRVIERRFIFGDEEKEFFVDIMRKLEDFLGVRVVTYSLMSNHFHILLEEPDKESKPSLTKESLLDLLPILYRKDAVNSVKQEFQRAADTSSEETNEKWEHEILARFERRRGDVSIFIKELKQRFSQWYNKRNGRRGTLWEDRYKSVLVEDDERALMTMAAYIDLNPIRAGLVGAPEDYRWCGYAEAVAGKEKARRGLGRVLNTCLQSIGDDFESDWATTAKRYRLWLYAEGEERFVGEPESEAEGRKRKKRQGFTRESVERENACGGEMPLPEVLRHRVRYFTDGAVLGSRRFVEKIFQQNRNQFGERRKTGARRMRGGDFGALRTMRNLKEDVIE